METADSNKLTDASAAPVAAGEPGQKRSRASGLLVPAAVALALAALLLTGFVWWQNGRYHHELATVRAGLQAGIDDTGAELLTQSDAIASVERALTQAEESESGLADDLASISVELRAQARRIEALQGGRLDARDSWLERQGEYYLVIANNELALRQDIDRAIGALALADDVLLELADPALADVRRAIARELQALRAVPQPDLEGLALNLGSLMERVPELPMRAAAPDNFGPRDDAVDQDEPGLARLWSQTKGAVTSIIRIERQKEPAELMLTEAERRLARRQLALELQIARTSVIERRAEDFRASLVAADDILNRDFDREQRSVVAARELLGQLMTVELEPALPDISDSLTLLRSTAGAR